MVTFLVAGSLCLFEAWRLAKRSSALAMPSAEITLPHLETREVEHSTEMGRRNYGLPIEGGSGQNVGGNEGREEESGDETWRDHGEGGLWEREWIVNRTSRTEGLYMVQNGPLGAGRNR